MMMTWGGQPQSLNIKMLGIPSLRSTVSRYHNQEFLYARGFWLPFQSLDIVRPDCLDHFSPSILWGPSAILASVTGCLLEREYCTRSEAAHMRRWMWKGTIMHFWNLTRRVCLRSNDLSSTSSFVAGKPHRMMWRRFGNHIINDGYFGPFCPLKVIRLVPFSGVSDIHLEPSFQFYKIDQCQNGSLLLLLCCASSFLLLFLCFCFLQFSCAFCCDNRSFFIPRWIEVLFSFFMFSYVVFFFFY